MADNPEGAAPPARAPAPPATPAPTPVASLRELALAYAIAAAMPAILLLLGRSVPFVASNLHVLVAATFLIVPFELLRRRNADLMDAGFVFGDRTKIYALVGLFMIVVVPLFAVGFGVFYGQLCAHWTQLAPRGVCASLRHGGLLELLRVPSEFPQHIATEVIVVAIPEELFFRGYLHGELEKRWPARRRLWGGGLGRALLLSSALFAVAHLAITPDPRRLLVFFPGLLFGWMRSATGSIVTGATCHASANLLMKVLATTYFGG